jgi:hypothetical protein
MIRLSAAVKGLTPNSNTARIPSAATEHAAMLIHKFFLSVMSQKYNFYPNIAEFLEFKVRLGIFA